jgi:uncharacterized protein (TIGR03435 family)
MRVRTPSVAIAVIVLAIASFAGQEPRAISFEAASIKPNPAPTSGALRGRVIVCQGVDGTIGRPAFVAAGPAGGASDPIPQGRCRAGNVTLLTLLATVYGVSERDVSGGPGWAASDGFQVEAKAENTTMVTAEDLRRMLRTLIADRFKVTVHREQREGQAFVLAVARNGLKLKQGSGIDQPLHTELRGQPGQQQVVLLGMSSMRDFAAVLASLPFTANALGGLPLLDRTGLTGTYNVNLTLNLVSREGGPPELDPSLSTALQEQLGLRLESQRVSLEAIVIDHAQRPSDN